MGKHKTNVLFYAQTVQAETVQAETNPRVSASMAGHQNLRRRRASVRVTPGWQASLEECAHCKTLIVTEARMKSLPVGPVPGSG